PLMLDCPDDAHNCMPRLVVFGRAEPDPFTEWTLVRPIFVRQPLVNDRDLHRVARIRVSKITPHQDRNAHRAKVVRGNHAMVDRRRLPYRKNRKAFDSQAAPPASTSQRQPRYGAGRLYAWQ